ncbi:MAG: molybdopterin-synthase adenylyltransferase MoeB [Gammaproteobacteria bacterium]|jgi:adenylyltransferase/sulfurtransferase|nr:molybdopterin-synthase adenylyltransferase MoeB [Gammaproteobacteria bacterium]
MDLQDEQLLRYSRQIMLPQVDAAGQMRLLESTVLVVGLGGLGAPVAMYLAAAGVGNLVVVDDDEVDLSNLQRQIIHTTADVGRPKVDSARDALLALNPELTITTVEARLEGALLRELVDEADVVVDACDNFATRFAINEACFASGTPLVSGAAIRLEGQVAVFDPRVDASPCYRCLYRDEGELAETCTQSGVFTPVVGIIGSLQATEALKLLVGLGEALTGRLLLLDAETMQIRTIRLPRDPKCPVCARHRTPQMDRDRA